MFWVQEESLCVSLRIHETTKFCAFIHYNVQYVMFLIVSYIYIYIYIYYNLTLSCEVTARLSEYHNLNQIKKKFHNKKGTILMNT